MMQPIKFSNQYYKLPPGIKKARLCLVEKVLLENQTNVFLNYDTMYEDDQGGAGHYQLPAKGEYLVLGFVSDSGAFFTTLRRATSEKETYYRALVGKELEVVIMKG